MSAAPRRPVQAEAPQAIQVATVQNAAPAVPAEAAPAPAKVQEVTAPLAPASEVVVPVTIAQTAGLWVHMDSETGTISTDAVSGIPGNELNDSDEGLVEETLWDGSKMVNLQGRFQEVFVVHMSPDGKRWIECAKTPSMKHTHVPAPAPASVYEER